MVSWYGPWWDYLQGTKERAQQVAADYALPVEAAMAYYHRHQALIDNRIAVNDAAFA